jgi:hypothetical protein
MGQIASTGEVRVLQLSLVSQCESRMTPTASDARTRGNKYVCNRHNAREIEGNIPANVREVPWSHVPRAGQSGKPRGFIFWSERDFNTLELL